MDTAISSAVPFEGERASPRLPLTVPVVIHGKDTRGKSVIERTHTVVVNQRGARVLTSHRFPLAASLNIAVPHLQRHSEATVVWLGPRDTEFQSIGIDLGQCGDLWGIELMETPPAILEETSHPNRNTSLAGQGSETEHKNGIQGSPLQADNSAKLSSAIEELVRTAIEQSLREILPRVTRDSEELIRAMNRTTIEQAQTHIDRLVAEAMRDLETLVAEVLARNEKTWQQTLRESAQTCQERLEAFLSECQNRLARRAEDVRHELARKLADLSATLDKA